MFTTWTVSLTRCVIDARCCQQIARRQLILVSSQHWQHVTHRSSIAPKRRLPLCWIVSYITWKITMNVIETKGDLNNDWTFFQSTISQFNQIFILDYRVHEQNTHTLNKCSFCYLHLWPQVNYIWNQLRMKSITLKHVGMFAINK